MLCDRYSGVSTIAQEANKVLQGGVSWGPFLEAPVNYRAR